MTLNLEQPLRYPDLGSAPLMTKRARWLVVLGFILPGSAQMLAGNRRLGRFGVGASITLLVLGVMLLLGAQFARTFTLTLLTNSIVLTLVQVLVAAYGVLWLVLGVDTLRLVRLVKVQPNWRAPVAIVSVLLTVLAVGGAGWAATTVGAARGAITGIFGGGAAAVQPVDGRYNILLLGTDAGADREGLRPDSISLVSVDAETGQSLIVGLPRELVDMPFPEDSPMHAIHPNGFGVGPNFFGDDGGCLTTCYLNAVYAELEIADDPEDPVYAGLYADAVSRGSEPGLEATKDAVEGATGLVVQFYVLIDMDGFSSLIDALGGVTVNVPEDLPIGGQVDEGSGELIGVEGWVEAGERHLNGYEAQWFARSRYGSSRGDYDRMDRQRQLQEAILAQMSPANVLLRFQSLAEAGTNLVATDIPESMLGRFVDLAAKAKGHSVVVVQLTPPAIDPEYPDYEVIQQMVVAGVRQASAPEVEAGG